MFNPNGVMMQYFHWYLPPDGSLWNQLSKQAKDLAELGITAVGLPPATKGTGGSDQYDYFDHANTIGCTRLGNEAHLGGVAVVLSNGGAGHKWMEVGQVNHTYVDVTEHVGEPVTTNERGWGEFRCPAGSASVWVPQS